jgi:carboxyl-terminal processing protease
LEEEIVKRYYFQKGRIEASFAHDLEITEALNLLQNPVRYQEILNPTINPKK